MLYVGGNSKRSDDSKQNSTPGDFIESFHQYVLIVVDLATGPTVTLGDGTECTLPATYLYDATSGFYYDSSTGLYFDPKSQVN